MADDQAKIKLTHADIAVVVAEMGMRFEPEQMINDWLGRQPNLWCVVQLLLGGRIRLSGSAGNVSGSRSLHYFFCPNS